MLTRGARPCRTRELHLVRVAIRTAVDGNEVIQKAVFGGRTLRRGPPPTGTLPAINETADE
jgi:hypothetical protein